jgi:hypothetical protein
MWAEANKRRTGAPSFRHLRRLTDDTGLIEHALGRIPRRKEGYTTDDNARALWAVSEWLAPERAALLSPGDRERLTSLADVYLAFMLWCQGDDGWFHNNIAYDRTPEPETRSHDCQGRAIWGCANAWVRLAAGQRETAFMLFQQSLRTIGRIDSLRGRAFALAACSELLQAEESGRIVLPKGWRGELKDHLYRLEELLDGAYRDASREGWHWFEPVMTYGNGVLPWAMLRAYRTTRRPSSLETGLDSLSSLQAAMTSEGGWYRPIGNEHWHTRDVSSRWDQQPLEMFKLALALEEAAAALESARKDGVFLVISPDVSGLGTRRRQEAGSLAAGSQTTASKPDFGRASDGTEPGAPESALAAGGAATAAGERKPRVVDIGEHIAALRASRDRCLDWFYGDNDLRVPMVDEDDGSCCDGLQMNGPNVNCGAEAALSYLMTEAICYDRRRANRA